jgi:hypothetical protein
MPLILQGNVILLPVQQLDRQKLSFLTLAEGEFPGIGSIAESDGQNF